MNLEFNISDKVYTTSEEFEEVNNYTILQFITSDWFDNIDLKKCIIDVPLEITGIGITNLETVYKLNIKNILIDNNSNTLNNTEIIRRHIFKTELEAINFVKNSLNKKIDRLIKKLENKKQLLKSL